MLAIPHFLNGQEYHVIPGWHRPDELSVPESLLALADGRIACTDMSTGKLHIFSGDKVNAADLGWDAKERLVLIPTFFDNRVVAISID